MRQKHQRRRLKMKWRRKRNQRRAVDFRLFREYLNLSTTAQNRLTYCHCKMWYDLFVNLPIFCFCLGTMHFY